MKKLVIALLVLAAVGAGVYLVPQLDVFQQLRGSGPAASKGDTPTTPPPAVSVVEVVTAEFTETAVVSGSLVPRDEILVTPEVEGFRVLDLRVDESDRVKKGDVLATLVSESLDAQIAQNDASLARADAAISRARSEIVAATARLEEATSAFERAKPLQNSGYLSKSTFDQREAAATAAQAQLVAARDGLKLAQAEKGQVEAQRRELEWRLANTKVTAPEDGIVSRRDAHIGALASSSAKPMFHIIARGEVELDAEVIETELARIHVGQKARIDVAGVGEVTGTVRLVSPEVNKDTRLGRVRIFLGDDPKLRIGGFARGVIDTAEARGLSVPTAAVVFDSSGAFVQVVRDGRVERRVIETGLVAAGLVEVREGLALGDVVVAKAGTFLRDGDAVRPVHPNSKISEAR
ncbi:MAG: efflux RND transporter periplasmic adaptor subunit [Hyphomicrobiaceae bacterium]|nr:efflux RND transporter periplasmic adaptor subunit [Hyphomicrobiaceae bacterium]